MRLRNAHGLFDKGAGGGRAGAAKYDGDFPPELVGVTQRSISRHGHSAQDGNLQDVIKRAKGRSEKFDLFCTAVNSVLHVCLINLRAVPLLVGGPDAHGALERTGFLNDYARVDVATLPTVYTRNTGGALVVAAVHPSAPLFNHDL